MYRNTEVRLRLPDHRGHPRLSPVSRTRLGWVSRDVSREWFTRRWLSTRSVFKRGVFEKKERKEKKKVSELRVLERCLWIVESEFWRLGTLWVLEGKVNGVYLDGLEAWSV